MPIFDDDNPVIVPTAVPGPVTEVNKPVQPPVVLVGTVGPQGPPGGGALTLSTLQDALIVTPTDGQVLMYVAAATKWENKAVNSAGLLSVANNLSDVGNVTTARSNLGLGTAATQADASYEHIANKAAASGYPSLNASSLVPTGQLGTLPANNTKFLRGDSIWATPVTGVTQILPGTNVSISPVGGTGAVTINSSATATALAALTDVILATPADKDVLTYIAAANKWENRQDVETGVTQVVAGSNISLSPVGGTGVVTVTSVPTLPVVTVATSGSSQTVSAGNAYDITGSTGSCALSFTGATVGTLAQIILVLRQDGTGNHAWTFPGSVRWPGGAAPALSTAIGGIDMLSFLSSDGGTTWMATGVATQMAVQVGGVAQTQRPALDFVAGPGVGLVGTDDAANSRTIITVNLGAPINISTPVIM